MEPLPPAALIVTPARVKAIGRFYELSGPLLARLDIAPAVPDLAGATGTGFRRHGTPEPPSRPLARQAAEMPAHSLDE